MSIKEMFNRYMDTTPVECASCHWTGKLGECSHNQEGMPFEEPEIVSRCPQCRSPDIRELLMEGAVV